VTSICSVIERHRQIRLPRERAEPFADRPTERLTSMRSGTALIRCAALLKSRAAPVSGNNTRRLIGRTERLGHLFLTEHWRPHPELDQRCWAERQFGKPPKPMARGARR
jgi:hypothetical protein